VIDSFAAIRSALVADPDNAWAAQRGWDPLYAAAPSARLVVVGQAPGARAQESGIPWDDPSGVTLRDWLGVSDAEFYDSERISLLPMDFYYPGRGRSGDLPPRRGFAATWHPQLLALMPEVQLTLLIGEYAQSHYLGSTAKRTLTETVRAFGDYLPSMIPLVHPSPLNFRWQAKNPWFAEDVLPALGMEVRRILQA